ncbi:MAG: DNA polymerase III subunit gamma/tau [Firmicutes bacterium]|nr:DNA polymerase III subunit gamma/tau [Bacillota bacterium]
MYQALYRSFRPETFDSLIGQEHIVRILTGQLKAGTTGHAYLFCGTRGTGKTTTARLLAKALNCTAEGDKPCGQCAACRAIASGTFLDVVEIDAASNNGVDDVRILREEVNFPPVEGKAKVYIIDEAHMLTPQACNALLKTLEEPPAGTVFILATTDPAKLPATILSRCIRLDFKRVPESRIQQRFQQICDQLKIEAEPEALALLAANADGSVRDGLSLLDRCTAGASKITRDDVLFLLGMSGLEVYLSITSHLLAKDTGAVLSEFAQVLGEGKEVARFTRDWIEHLRNLLIVKYVAKPEKLLNLSAENIARLKQQSQSASTEALRDAITALSKALADARWAPRPRIIIELALIELCAAK